MAWTAPRTFVAGETVTDTIMNTHVRDNLLAIGTSIAWATYSPAVTATTTNPTMTVAGSWSQVGKRILANVRITTVTALGSGTYSVSLPAATDSSYATDDVLGTVKFRTNAGVYVMGMGMWGTTTTVSVLIPTPGGTNPNMGRWSNTAPAGQVAGDTWNFMFEYQAA